MNEAPIGKRCGCALIGANMEIIRAAKREADPPKRAEIARWVWTALNWVDMQLDDTKKKDFNGGLGVLNLESRWVCICIRRSWSPPS